MPKAPSHADHEIAERFAQRQEFENSFQRSRKGNLWCRFGSQTLTVFSKPEGGFGWCISYGKRLKFSPSAFDEEDEAIGSLADAVFLYD
jgi:hypothetical protein